MKETLDKILGLDPDLLHVSNDIGDLHVSAKDMIVKIKLRPFIDPFGIDSVADDERSICQYTKFAWTRVGSKRWILNPPKGKGYFELSEKG